MNMKVLLHDLSSVRILGIVPRGSQWGRADASVVLGECSHTTATGRVTVSSWGVRVIGEEDHGRASLMNHQPCRLPQFVICVKEEHRLP